MLTSDLFNTLLDKVKSFLHSENLTGYLVGGTVRDFILGKFPADIDLVVIGDVSSADKLAAFLDVVLVKFAHPTVVRLVLPFKEYQIYIDVEYTTEGDILDNLGRRDFTINAMALPLRSGDLNFGKVIDPYRGRDDIEKKTIRAVNPQVFKEDAVRILRAFRLASGLDFFIEDKTLNLLCMEAVKVDWGKIAGERIWKELRMILGFEDSLKTLLYMQEKSCVLDKLFGNRNLEDNAEVNTWSDKFVRLKFLEEFWKGSLTADIFDNIRSLYEKTTAEFVEDITPAIKLAVLLDNFASSERRNVKKAKEVCDFLRMPGWEKDIVLTVVKGYSEVSKIYKNNLRDLSAKRRFVNKYNKYTPILLIFSLADFAADNDNIDGEVFDYACYVEDFLQFYLKEGREWFRLPRYINGDKVMEILGVRPSSKVGNILRMVVEKEITGQITNEKEAQDFVKFLKDSKYP